MAWAFNSAIASNLAAFLGMLMGFGMKASIRNTFLSYMIANVIGFDLGHKILLCWPHLIVPHFLWCQWGIKNN
jgi:hypothetical protein